MSSVPKNEYEDESPTDLARIWIDAQKKYYDVAEVSTEERKALERRSIRNIDDMISDRSVERLQFRKKDGQAYVRFRHAIAKNADLIITGASYIASAASAAFPPSSAILTAFTYLLQVCGDISKAYDKIEGLLGEVNNFLEQVKLLETRVPKFETYRSHILRVFTAVLTVCGQATKAVKRGRLKMFGKMILKGGVDPELASAGGLLEDSLKRLMIVTSFATLTNTEIIKTDLQDFRGQYTEGFEILVELGKNSATEVGEAKLELLKVSKKLDIFFAAQRPPASESQGSGQAPTRDSLSATETILHLFQNLHDKSSVERDISLAAVNGTCQWLFDEPIFQDWAGPMPKSKILWLTGGPGCGKSFMAWSISKQLQQSNSGGGANIVATLFIRPNPPFRSEDTSFDQSYFEDLTVSVICQVARQSADFAEKTCKKILEWNEYGKFPSYANVMWRELLATYFTGEAASRLYVIFDGMDQAPLDYQMFGLFVQELQKMLRFLVRRPLNIQVMLVGRDGWARKMIRHAQIPCQILQIKPAQIADDVRLIVEDKIEKLPVLRKMPTPTKEMISLTLPNRCQNILHVDLVMRRLGNMSRISPILSKIRDLSTGDTNMLKLMEEEITARRAQYQLRSLKIAYGFLTYFHQPLTVDEVNFIVSVVANDPSFDIEEEILIRSNVFLELDVLDAPAGKNETYGDQSDKGTLGTSSDRTWIVRFNHAAIREHFEITDQDDYYSLRSFRTTFEGWLFILCAKIVCQLVDNAIISSHLKTYAASFWPFVLLKVDDKLDERDLRQAASLMQSLLSNQNNVALFLDRHRPKLHSAIGLKQGFSSQWIDYGKAEYRFLPEFEEWLQRAIKRGPSCFDETTYKWMEDSISHPETIMQPLAQAYAQNWLEGKFINRDSAFAVFDYMTMAGLLDEGHSYGWQVGDKRFEEIIFTAKSGEADFNALLAVADHFDSIEWYEKAILKSKNNEDRFRARIRQMYLQIYPKPLHEFEIMYADEMTFFFMADEEKWTAQSTDREKVVERLKSYSTQATELESLLANTDRDVLQQRDPVCLKRGLITYAGCLRATREFKKGAAIVQELRQRYPDEVFSRRLFSCGLDPDGDPVETLTTIQNWNVIDRLFWLIHDRYRAYRTDCEPHQLLWRCAREGNQKELVGSIYEELINYLDNRKCSGTTRVMYAKFVYSLHHDQRKVREILSKILDDHSIADPLTSNPFNEGYTSISIANVEEILATMLYNQYQTTPARDTKNELIKELEALNEIVVMGQSDVQATSEAIQISDVRISVVLARLFLQGGNYSRFEELLKFAFKYCIGALTDKTTGNDREALGTLAKILACLDLKKEAQIAATIRFANFETVLAGKRNLWYESDWSDRDMDDESEDESEPEDRSFVDRLREIEDGRKEDYLSEEYNDSKVRCSACHKWEDWRGSHTTRMYMCLDCCDEFDLCQECYEKMQTSKGPPWHRLEILCEANHKYVRLPMAGWKGVTYERMWIGDEKINFKQWLRELETEQWEDAWTRFWSRGDGIDNIL